MSEAKQGWCVLLGFLVFVAGCLALIWQGVRDSYEARESKHWPVTTGTVVSHSTSSHDGRTGERHEPIVGYTYTVDGVAYKDSRLAWYTETFGTEYEATEYMNAQFPIGGSIPIHYDPRHPHHACVLVGGTLSALVPALSAGFVLVVIFVRLFIWPARPRTSVAGSGAA